MKRIIAIKRVLSKQDLIPKIICLFLAAVLWAYINSINIKEERFRVPIKTINLPQNLVISNMQTKFLTISLSGRADELKHINTKNLEAVVNLENPAIGMSRKYPIYFSKNEVPDNIEVILDSKEVAITIESIIYKRVKIEANIDENVKEGYFIGSFKIYPEYATISGPESLIKTVDVLHTEPISIGDGIGRIIKVAYIDKRNIEWGKIDINRVKVEAQIIESVNVHKIEKDIELKNTNDDYKYTIIQDNATIFLKADKENITPSDKDVEVFIDLSSIDIKDILEAETITSIERNYTVNAIIRNKHIRIVSVIPDSVTVKIEKK